MSDSSESKRLLRTALIVAVVGAIVFVSLAWLYFRMKNDAHQRKVMAANESTALSALASIQAAEQLYLETNGQYATFPQLVEAGVFQAPLTGDALVSGGYIFALKVRPRTDAASSFYSVNADPQRSGGRDATGRRHFYIDSEVTGIRFNEERPATASDKPRPSMQEY
jgi:Tfp pilus assembly protein PilE